MDYTEIQTPCYIINYEKYEKNCLEFEKNFHNMWGDNLILAYSVKTNNSKIMLSLAHNRNWYMETVSEREYEIVTGEGYDKVILNGPIKGEALKDALQKNYIINLDNYKELEKYIELHKIFNIDRGVGLRVNFDLERNCPGETTAGMHPSRFGFCLENFSLEKAIETLKINKINIDGLHMHTSTKSRSIKVFSEICRIVCELKEQYNLKLKYIDIGGGFFGGRVIDGKPTISEYASVICGSLKEKFNPQNTTLILEPGASITATAVDYVTKVDSVRNIRNETIVTVDGSLLHINPFMVDREPEYEIIGKRNGIKETQWVCGSTCMENDRLLLLLNEEGLNEDNYIVFHNAGAYTMSFNSEFINKIPNVFLKDKK